MKLKLRMTSLLVLIGIFGFSSIVSAQKTTSNKAKPKAGTNSATPKKAKNINTGEIVNPNNGKTRPASTGNGNGNGRPASTGETLSDRDRIERSVKILMFAGTFPNGTVEDSGSNLSRTRGFINQAYSKAWDLKQKYVNANNQNVNYESNYSTPRPDDMSDVKSNLQEVLNYLNAVSFETEQNHRASAIDFTERAINQIDSYLINPPAAKKTRPAKQSPNGANAVSGKSGSQLGDNQKQMVNQNGVDTKLKTSPAGANGQPAKPAKTTKTKPKVSSKTTKPTGNLDPLDDPWGKSPKKPKTKGSN